MTALSMRPCAFTCFSVFGTPDETLALAFDILLQTQIETEISIMKLKAYTSILILSTVICCCQTVPVEKDMSVDKFPSIHFKNKNTGDKVLYITVSSCSIAQLLGVDTRSQSSVLLQCAQRSVQKCSRGKKPQNQILDANQKWLREKENRCSLKE